MKRKLILSFLISTILAATYVLTASIQPPYQSFRGHFQALIQADAPSGNGYGGTLVYDTAHSQFWINNASLGLIGSNWSIIGGGPTLALLTNFTDSNASGFQNITGLSVTLPSGQAQNVPLQCNIQFTQATQVSDSFGVKDSVAPTRIDGYGLMSLAGAGVVPLTYGNLTNLTSTTATAIVTGTPSVSTANLVQLYFTVQQPASTTTAPIIQIVESQATAADTIVNLAGSSCVTY